MLSERRKLHRKRAMRSIVLPLAILGVIFALLYLIFFTSIFQIREFVVAHPRPELQTLVEDIRNSDNPMDTNALLFPRWRLREYAMTKFPEISSVDFSYDIRKKIMTIAFQFRAPAFLVCPALPLETAENQPCLTADGNGFIFGIQTEQGQQLPAIVVDSPLVIGMMINDFQLSMIAEISSQFERLQLTSRKTFIFSSDNDLAVQSENMPTILLTLDLPLSVQFDKLERFLTNEQLRKEFSIAKLEYIDLRIPEKVFVK